MSLMCERVISTDIGIYHRYDAFLQILQSCLHWNLSLRGLLRKLPKGFYIYNRIIKQLLNSVFAWSRNYQGLGLCCPPQPSASADKTNLGLDNSRCHAQPHPIIVNYPDRETWDKIERIPAKAPHENKTLFKKKHGFFVPDFFVQARIK